MMNKIQPRIVGEFEDSAMQKAFEQAGQGIFPGSAIMNAEIYRQYQVEVLGEGHNVTQRLYAHTIDRNSNILPWSRYLRLPNNELSDHVENKYRFKRSRVEY